jgi:hypothetical protein
MADGHLKVHGWNLPVTRFTPEEFAKVVQLDKALKTEVVAHGGVLEVLADGGVLKDCGEIGRQVLNLVYASIHRADPTLSLAAVSTVIYDFQDLMTVCHRITSLTLPLPKSEIANANVSQARLG